MTLLQLGIRNATQDKLRVLMTVLAIAISVLAFVALRTVLDAWSLGALGQSSRAVLREHGLRGQRVRSVPGGHARQGRAIVELALGRFLEQNMGKFFPSFRITSGTALLSVAACVTLSLCAAFLPAHNAGRLTVAAAVRRLS